MSRLVERYETVKELLPAKDEQEVKIAEMYVYPLRSVRAGPVDELEVGRYGIKYDREIVLAPDERAILRVVREGPWVIDPSRALTAAAHRGLFVDLGHWHDQRSGATGCC